MRAVDPTTGETLAEYAEPTEAEAAARLERAARAYRGWSAMPVASRVRALTAAAGVLRAREETFARIAVREMGKPIAAARAEVEKCAWLCDHLAATAEAALAPEPVTTAATASYVRYDPFGVVLAVMPWNFPYWQAFRAATPAIAAGNAVVLKHSSNVPGCALAIEEIWHAAGLPEDVFATLLVPAAAVGALVDHPAVAAVTLTGSEAAGAAIGARAGAALKKTVLELGGSDAFLVLADADPEQVAAQAVLARLVNNGESCIAAKRFIVEQPVAGRFEAALRDALAAVRVGDPGDPGTQLGPLARADLVETLDRQVRASVAAGARLALGGGRLERPGFFYAPTLLLDVRPGMPAFDEETFGPLAAVTRARDADDAVALANRSAYGLGASVWTRDRRRGEALAARLEAGMVFVNAPVASDPRLPFGGVKRSGHGRELGLAGVREFVNVKTVWAVEA